MHQDPKDIILNILTIIGFTDDKEAAADEFIQNCEKQALLDILVALPVEKQDALKRQLAGVKDQDQQKAIIAEYVSSEQYQESLQKASATAFEGLIEEVIPTLSKEQTDKLQSYFTSFTKPVAST